MPEITKQDALRRLDMQRDAVNTEITYAAPSEQKQYHAHLKIINRLAELVRLDSGEMTAVEYAKAHDEICDAHKHCLCASCPLGGHCTTLVPYGTDIKPAVEIVKLWKEEQS